MAEPTRKLFRAEALDRAASPDDLERLMPLTGSKDWLLIAVTGALLSLVVVWAVVGRVPTIVAGRGVILGRSRSGRCRPRSVADSSR